MVPFGVEPEYLELVEPDTLEPVGELTRAALLVLAARIGGVRLIDNALLAPSVESVQPAEAAGRASGR